MGLQTAKELAKTLKVALQTVYDWRAKGIIAFAEGRKFDVDDCRRCLADHGIIPGGGPGRPARPTEPSEGMTHAEAERRKMVALAETAELNLAVKRRNLVDREAAERKVYELATASRDSWRTWPLDDAEIIAADLGIADVAMVRRVLEARVSARLAKLPEIAVRLST